MKNYFNILKPIIVFSIIIITTSSCNLDKKGFEFDNFKNTPVWQLAQAVSDNDVEKIREFAALNKNQINLEEPIWKQTLLTLAIVNKKKEAFLELLKVGANPNKISGNNLDTSSLTEAILNQDDCQLFYIENLLKNGANPNLKIIPNDGNFFSDYYPLFTAIRKGVNGDDCLDILELLIKYGADINCCNPNVNDTCEGVISECLSDNCMSFLSFFVIKQKIKIPKIAYITGGIDISVQKKYTLTETLNTKNFIFEDYIQNGKKIDNSKLRKIRAEILGYLKQTGQY